MGGKSIEKEVSFNSGRTVCDHLDTALYTIIPLFYRQTGQLYILPLKFLHRGKISDFEEKLDSQAQEIKFDDLTTMVDFIFLALHGRYAEDGTIQGMLEILNIPYLGSKILASSLGMDKIMQKKILHMANINVARDISLQSHEQISPELIEQAGLSYPLIVKPHLEGSSLGIFAIHNVNELVEKCEQAAMINPESRQAIIIEEVLHGMEFSCIIITDYATGQLIPLPPTEIVTEKNTIVYDYEQKYMPGRASKFTPARCTPQHITLIQEACIKTMHALNITNIGRIDGFLTHDNKIYIIDPNTISGMGPASFVFLQAAEINMTHTDLINHLIKTELISYGIMPHEISLLPISNKSMETINTTRKRVVVLFGGTSSEKEISLESGRNVIYKLSPQYYDVIPLFINKDFNLYHINQKLLVRNSTHEIEQEKDETQKVNWHDLPTIADFVFIALHGDRGENGAVQGTLELLGLPYNGSGVLTSALCMDKYKTTQLLAQEGFDVPQSLLVNKENWTADQDLLLTTITTFITAPWVIKPHNDGCSTLVMKANNFEELAQSLHTIFNTSRTFALVEEYILGTELTVGVIGNEHCYALPPSKTVTASSILSLEEKFLPGAGENQTPAPLSSTALALVKNTMERAYILLGCRGYVRIDCFYQSAQQSATGKERVIIIEVNTLPALTPATCLFHQAAEIGINPMDFITMIVQFGCARHQGTSINLFDFFNPTGKLSDVARE